MSIRSRLKWGFIPKRRIVDEDEFGHFIKPTTIELKADEKESEKVEEVEISPNSTLEYRDEANRPWWKFFDEYEYRVTSRTKSNRKWYKWFHDDDTPEERRLIIKLDILLTLYSLMAYWVKYLDQTNLVNAYISGLQEDIGMVGNDFVNTQVMFSVGNIVLQIPFMYIFYSMPLCFVMPTLDISWSVLTIALSQAKNVAGLKAMRFFIGALEAPAYIAYHAMFASWFRSSTGEIARRAGFYYLGQYLGVLTSGLLSGAIERGMSGLGGYASWQWIFIMDGIISIIVGLIGYYVLPGTPEDCYSIFLTDDDIRVARRRMQKDQKDTKPRENAAKHFFSLDIWKQIFSTWHFYVICIWNVFCWNNSNAASGSFAFFLQSLTNSNGEPRFGVGKLQDLTALTPGIGLIYLVLVSLFADLFKCRWGAIVFSQVFNVLGNVLLAIWHIPENAKWFAFILQYSGWAMAPVLYSWQGDLCRKDLRLRQVVLVSMNILAQSSTAFISVLVWPTVEAPRYLKGFSFTAASGVALSLWTFVVLWFYKRDERANARENGIILINSNTDTESTISESKKPSSDYKNDI